MVVALISVYGLNNTPERGTPIRKQHNEQHPKTEQSPHTNLGGPRGGDCSNPTPRREEDPAIIKLSWKPSGLNSPMQLLVILWAVDIAVFMFREPAIAAVLMAMALVVVARNERGG